MASRGINKVILVGFLGHDPEIGYLPAGGEVATLSLANSESWRDKQSGEQKEKTEWHRVVLFGKLAEIAGEYLIKCSQVYIEGQLRTRKWFDEKNGTDRFTTEIVVGQQGAAFAGWPCSGCHSRPQASGGWGNLNSHRPLLTADSFRPPQVVVTCLRWKTISRSEWTESCSITCR